MYFDQFLRYFVEFMHLLQRPLLQIHKQNGTYQFWAKVTLAQHVITNVTVFKQYSAYKIYLLVRTKLKLHFKFFIIDL